MKFKLDGTDRVGLMFTLAIYDQVLRLKTSRLAVKLLEQAIFR